MSVKPEDILILANQYTDDTIKGSGGLKGDPGASAYEIAVANGFEGTEQQWLESLKAEFEIDTTPTLGSANAVTSGGVYKFNKENLIIASPVSGWYRIAENVNAQWGDGAIFNIGKPYGSSNTDNVLFSVSLRYNKSPSIVQLNRCFNVNNFPKCRVVYKSSGKVYVDIYLNYTVSGSYEEFIISVSNAYKWKLYENATYIFGVDDGYTAYEFEFSESGIKADLINGIDLADKLDNIPAKAQPYDTGRIWLDGNAIFRIDFSIKVNSGSNYNSAGKLPIREINPVLQTIIIVNSNVTTRNNGTASIYGDLGDYNISFEPTIETAELIGFIEYINTETPIYTVTIN